MPGNRGFTLEEITAVIKNEIKAAYDRDILPKLDTITTQLTNLSNLQEKVNDLEQSVDFASRRIDDLYSKTLPSLASHMETISNALTLRILDMDMHRRKWSLTMHGLKGPANETEDQTRSKCVDLAKTQLRINDAHDGDFSACHRLKPDADSGVILRFKDLRQRNRLLANAKHLKGSDRASVSISPDLPPVLRPLKKELLNQRRQMPPDEKSRCSVHHLRSWPYVELHRRNGASIRPATDLSDVMKQVLGVPALLNCVEPSD